MRYVLKLKDVNKKLKFLVGGKAAYLGELIKNGYNVPNGFCLTINAFKLFMRHNSILKKFPFLSLPNSKDWDIENNWKNLKGEIINSHIPDIIKELIITEYTHLLSKKKVVVRSSALCEDDINYSYAGLFETKLNIQDKSQLFESIITCYSSLFDIKIKEYMRFHNISFNKLAMGIIIQEFIEGEKSGVVFTADSSTQERNVIVINTVFGLCKGAVSGEVESDLIKVDKLTKKIIEQNIVNNKKQIIRIGRNIVIKSVNKKSQNNPVLTKSEIRKICNEVIKIENIFRYHLDIEWTIFNNRFYWLQVRPLTTVKPFPVKWKKSEDKNHSWQLITYLPCLMPLISEFYQISSKSRLKGWQKIGLDWIEKKEVNGYFFWKKITIKNKKELFSIYKKKNLKLYKKGKILWEDIYLPIVKNNLTNLRNKLKYSHTINELTNLLKLAVHILRKNEFIHSQIWGDSRANISPISQLEKECRKYYPQTNSMLISQMIYSSSIIADFFYKISEIINMIKKHPPIFYDLKTGNSQKFWESVTTIKEIKKEIDWFVSNYGFLPVKFDNALYVYNIKERCIIEDKENNMFNLLKANINLSFDDMREQRKIRIKEKEKIIDFFYKKIESKAERESFKLLLLAAEKDYRKNETHLFYIEYMTFSLIRLILREIAIKLEKNKLISNIEDIYFLKLRNIYNLDRLNIHKIINKMKKEYEINTKLIPPPYIGMRPAEKQKINNLYVSHRDKEIKEENELVKGISNIKIRLRGRIKKIIYDQHLNYKIPNIRKGDIIIVPPINLIMMTLFRRLHLITALILEMDTPFTHNGILATEMGIPVLFNAIGASKVLNDGQEVIFDGYKGKIFKCK